MSYYLPSGDYVMEMKQSNDELWWEGLSEEEKEKFRQLEADRRYDEMRDREMEEKQLRQRSAYPAFRSMRRSGHE